MSEVKIDRLAIAYLAQFPQEAAQILPAGDAKTIADILGGSMPPLQADQVGAVLAALPSQTASERWASPTSPYLKWIRWAQAHPASRLLC